MLRKLVKLNRSIENMAQDGPRSKDTVTIKDRFYTCKGLEFFRYMDQVKHSDALIYEKKKDTFILLVGEIFTQDKKTNIHVESPP